ncbi:MAG: cytochrome-c peroxidase [Acidobacteria bacterium]|nr:cytochrome-c peroxidase [Acidobacteriota bacterium]
MALRGQPTEVEHEDVEARLVCHRARSCGRRCRLPAKVELGRRLFFESRISADAKTACATCHEPGRAFTDGRRVPAGVHGRQGRRNVAGLVALLQRRRHGDGAPERTPGAT